jgi:hypothetical protein
MKTSIKIWICLLIAFLIIQLKPIYTDFEISNRIEKSIECNNQLENFKLRTSNFEKVKIVKECLINKERLEYLTTVSKGN